LLIQIFCNFVKTLQVLIIENGHCLHLGGKGVCVGILNQIFYIRNCKTNQQVLNNNWDHDNENKEEKLAWRKGAFIFKLVIIVEFAQHHCHSPVDGKWGLKGGWENKEEGHRKTNKKCKVDEEEHKHFLEYLAEHVNVHPKVVTPSKKYVAKESCEGNPAREDEGSREVLDPGAVADIFSVDESQTGKINQGGNMEQASKQS